MNDYANKRISPARAGEIWRTLPLNELGLLADSVRREKHPDGTATYIVDRNINYTNICSSKCLFCAYHADNDGREPFLLTEEEIGAKIRETLDAGGIQILLQGGLHPDLDIRYFEKLFDYIKSNYDIHLHALSPPEIIHIADNSGLSIAKTIERLKKAGLDSIPGGGAEILSDEIRKRVSPHKCAAKHWLEVMETAHESGLRTTATMMFGMGETVDERIEHLEKIRSLQDRTGGFTAFIPWTFQPGNTRLNVPAATSFEYLKMLALARIYLDNFDNIQVSWVTQGSGIAQLGLHFGANDFGSTMMEENVVRAAGVTFRLGEDEIRYSIENAGFIPGRRTMSYEVTE